LARARARVSQLSRGSGVRPVERWIAAHGRPCARHPDSAVCARDNLCDL
jgi:hypothetical protein